LWFGFPPSTALMLFVLWPAPTLFVVLYVWKFDDWFLDPVSARRLLSQRGGDNELT
jgi:hypothetical protein